jgi:hypothetical protein
MTGCAVRAIVIDVEVVGTADVGVAIGLGLIRLPIELGGNRPVLMGDRGDPDFWGESAKDESDGRRPMSPLGPLPVLRSVL